MHHPTRSRRRLWRGLLALAMYASLGASGACDPATDAQLINVGPRLQGLGHFEPGLGVGVNEAETKTFGHCVTTPLGPKIPGFASRLYDELAIRSRSELDTALNVDAAVSAQGTWGSAGGRGSYFKSVNMTSAGFYWLVHAEYRTFDQPLDMKHPDFQLTDAARRVLAGPGGLQRFRRACGDAFYSGMRLGARYALLYEFTSEETETIERIKAHADYSGWGVKARADFENLTQMAQKSSILKVHAESEGGGTGLTSYATSPEDLEHQLARLRSDLIERGEGVPLQYYTTNYDIFPEIAAAREAEAQLNDDLEGRLRGGLRKVALRELYGRFTGNVDALQRIAIAIKRGQGAEPLARYGDEKRERLRDFRLAIEGENKRLASYARKCLDDDARDEECSSAPSASIPCWEDASFEQALVPDQDYTTLQGWGLFLAQAAEKSPFLQMVGFPPDGSGNVIRFQTGYLLADTPQGILANALEGPEAARVIGGADRVPDPGGGQLRPNICVYNSGHVCALRVVPLTDEAAKRAKYPIKLQIVFYDQFGFIEQRTDLPIVG